MTAEQDLLRRLQAVLSSADIDTSEFVESAWSEAREEAQAALRRLMVHDLLTRAADVLDGEPAATADHAVANQGESMPVAEERAEPAAPVYLFGIGRSDLTLSDAGPARVPGSGPLRMVEHDGLRAIVTDVDPAVFEDVYDPEGPGLRILAEAAQAHDRVLADLAASAPVLPLRLGTVVGDTAAVEAILARHRDQLRDELDRIAGHAEWSVTVHLLDGAPNRTADGPDPAASGRDYLERRRQALDEREQRLGWRDQVAGAIHAELATTSAEADVVERRPLEDETPPLLHGVYLLADDARPCFERAVDFLRERHSGISIEVSGPWPPYHFVSLDLRAEQAGAT